jgi:hypothetical protein
METNQIIGSIFAAVGLLIVGLLVNANIGSDSTQGVASAEIKPVQLTIEPRPTSAAIIHTDTPLQAKADPTRTQITFTDAVPAADSPERTADSMNACFSAYTRNKNTAENTCKGEWYPADYAPHSYDVFWCATNGDGVGWVPVRFFDNRSVEVVLPFGKPEGCH